MNPVDHPHGGGEGKNSVGRKSPLTPWGKPALGIKTRGRKTSDKFIVRRRNEKIICERRLINNGKIIKERTFL